MSMTEKEQNEEIEKEKVYEKFLKQEKKEDIPFDRRLVYNQIVKNKKNTKENKRIKLFRRKF